MAEFTKTKRGARSLHLNGFQYTLNKRGHNGNTYWTCVDRGCSGRATLEADDTVVSENNSHNYPPNPHQHAVSKAVDEMKDRASTEGTPMQTVYNNTMVAMARDPAESAAVAVVPTVHSLDSSLYRHRRKRLPPMPATIDDVSLTGEWSKTLGGQRFLVKSEDNVHVLATNDNIKLLAESEELYMDGTFKSSPRLFHQVYTIHVFKHGKQFPLVYCLLPGKSQIIYAKLFAILSDAMDNLMLQPQFQRVTSDFELAMIQAVKAQFSFVSVKGCFFHYAQAIWRKVQTLGLQDEYKSNPDLNEMVSKMLALSLCPIQFVRVSWSSIKSAAPQVHNIDELCKYYEDTWLNGSFPIASWNHYATEGPRTNNHVEGWHKKLNVAAGKTHPNVFENC